MNDLRGLATEETKDWRDLYPRTFDHFDTNARLTEPPPSVLAEAAGITTGELRGARMWREAVYQAQVDGLADILSCPRQGADDVLVHAEKLFAVQRAVHDLPARLQRAIACFDEDTTLREVGEELGVSEGRVCQLRKRAVRLVRDAVESVAA